MLKSRVMGLRNRLSTRGGERMAAQVRSLRVQRQKLQAERGAELRQFVLGFDGLDPGAAAQIVALIDRVTACKSGWSFVQVEPERNSAVVDWIFREATRPVLTAKLWAKLPLYLHPDTNEIVASRTELAEAVGTLPRHISTALGELEGIGAVERSRDGHKVLWTVNPKIMTRQAGEAREKAQRKSADLLPFSPGVPQD